MLLSGSVLAASSETSDDLFGRFLDSWRAQKTISARFEQVQSFVGFDEPLKSKGRLRILRPRYFELRYEPPHEQIQVCDGETIWTYMKEQAQVFKGKIAPDAGRSVDLLDWALEEATAAGEIVDERFFEEPARRIELTPGPNLPLTELRLWLEPDGDPELLGYESVDTEGNRTTLHLIDVDYGRKLAPEQFQFEVPSDVEVIEVGSSR